MFNLNDFMNSRATFKDVSYNNTKLRIVSLGSDLIEKLKDLTTHDAMYDFVANQGLAWNNARISDSVKSEALDSIWDDIDMQSDKSEIVDAICALSDITSILADKLKVEEDEAKELADLQAKEDKDSDEVEAHEENENLIKKALAENPGIPLEQLEADVNAHNNAA